MGYDKLLELLIEFNKEYKSAWNVVFDYVKDNYKTMSEDEYWKWLGVCLSMTKISTTFLRFIDVVVEGVRNGQNEIG